MEEKVNKHIMKVGSSNSQALCWEYLNKLVFMDVNGFHLLKLTARFKQ